MTSSFDRSTCMEPTMSNIVPQPPTPEDVTNAVPTGSQP